MSGLEKFGAIILDYTAVPTIGQAFADEIYRVFHNAHPAIEIRTVNANEAVNFMVTRAQTS
jgi:hypothetical protein